MDRNEAKEIILAGLAYAGWTDKQKLAFQLAFGCIQKVEILEKEIKQLKEKIDEAIKYCEMEEPLLAVEILSKNN